MAVWASIPGSQLAGATRLDAEYYQPNHAANRTLIASLSVGRIPIGKASASVRKGIFDIKAATYSEAGIPFVRISNLRRGLIDHHGLAYIPASVHETESKTALARGDIVLSKTAYVAASYVNLEICNISQDIIGIKIATPWKDRLRSAYVVAFLNSRHGRLLLEQWLQGNVQMHLALPDVKSVPIPLVGRHLQEAVESAWLTAARLLDDAELLFARALLQVSEGSGLRGWTIPRELAFVRSLSGTIADRRLDAEHFQPVYEELRALLMRHLTSPRPLSQVVSVSTHTIDPHSSPTRPIKYVELGSINEVLGTIDEAEEILGAEAPGRARMLLQRDDVLVSSVEGSLSKVALVPPALDGAVGSTGFVVLRPRDHSGFFLALVKSPVVQLQLRRECSGTILAALPSDALDRVLVPDFPRTVREDVDRLVRQAHGNAELAEALLEQAMSAVDKAVEGDEPGAIDDLRTAILPASVPIENEPANTP